MNETALLDRLAHRLWDERHVVTVLLYKLTVTRLLLAADERRFLPDAVREVDHAVHLLRIGEQARDDAVRELADHWQIDPVEVTLEHLSRAAPAPYDHTFHDHLMAFRTLGAEVEGAARENRVLARSDLAAVSEQLDLLTGTPPAPTIYDAQGHLDPTGPVGGRLREVL